MKVNKTDFVLLRILQWNFIPISIENVLQKILGLEKVENFPIFNFATVFGFRAIIGEFVDFLLDIGNSVSQNMNEIFEHIKLSICYFALLNLNLFHVGIL